MSYGFEIFGSDGELNYSSDNYGWIVLDEWVVKPVVLGRISSKSWSIPAEFTDFKLVVDGAAIFQTADTILQNFVTIESWVSLYENLGYTINTSGGFTQIDITLREFTGFPGSAQSTNKSSINAFLLGR